MSWLYLRFAAINVENRGNGHVNRRYLTCQISVMLYVFRGDRRIKSLSVSLALRNKTKKKQQQQQQQQKTKQNQKGKSHFFFI